MKEQTLIGLAILCFVGLIAVFVFGMGDVPEVYNLALAVFVMILNIRVIRE